MARIFGREAPLDHPLEARLAALDGSATAAAFIAETWRYDGRVCPAREGEATGRLCHPTAASVFGTPIWPTTTRGSARAFPRSMVGPATRRTSLTDSIPIPCSAAWSASITSARPPPRGCRRWREWRRRSGTRGWTAKLRREGCAGPNPELRPLLERLFEAWNKWSELDERPAWVSSWEYVEPLLAEESWADRVRDALGLGGFREHQWLVLLRYAAEEVDRYYRPSCLEAGWQPWHMISPPEEPTGFAMGLSGGTRPCSPEVIHVPMDLHAAHWTGYLDRTSTSRVGAESDGGSADSPRRNLDLARGGGIIGASSKTL